MNLARNAASMINWFRLFAIHWNQLQAGSRFVSGRGSRFPRLRTQLGAGRMVYCIASCPWYRQRNDMYVYIYIYTGAPLSYPSLAYLSHLPPPTRVLHTLREREKCVCFESGIISSIKSGLVPRECSVCVLACSIRDPPPTWDKPPFSTTLAPPTPSNFPRQPLPLLSSPPLPSTPRGSHPCQMEPNRLIIFV